MKRIIDAMYLIFSVAGAVLVALNIGYQLVGYILFLLSSILGSVLILGSNASRSLLTVNIIFAIINIVGIIRA